MAVSLLTPILDDGILNTNFFQGRVLSAEDLQTEQRANRSHRQHLGRAIGPGIIEGLEVSLVAAGSGEVTPTLGISPGIALNGKGQDLRLAIPITLSLSDITAPVGATAGLFAPSSTAPTGVVRGGEGVHVLVLSPASGFRERAPTSGLDRDGKAIGCGSRYGSKASGFGWKRRRSMPSPSLPNARRWPRSHPRRHRLSGPASSPAFGMRWRISA